MLLPGNYTAVGVHGSFCFHLLFLAFVLMRLSVIITEKDLCGGWSLRSPFFVNQVETNNDTWWKPSAAKRLQYEKLVQDHAGEDLAATAGASQLECH